jgi:hypothetical protein
MPIRFARPHKKMLYGVFMLLWLSGALWLVFHYFFRVEGEFGIAPHPAEIWWLRLHGLMVFAGLVALGTVLPVHARRAWQLNKNRRSGLLLKALFLWLALSGYALYYFASEGNENWLPLVHWGAGISVPLILALHIRMGRKRSRILGSMPGGQFQTGHAAGNDQCHAEPAAQR